MKSVQRKMGTFMKRSENEADVNNVMSDFKAVDDMLDRLIKDVKAWQTAWQDILKFQYDASEAFVELYKPIESSGEGVERRHQDQQTPAQSMQRAVGLQKEYSDEKADLQQEIEMIKTKLLGPAEDAKQNTKLLQKTLKHRENTKLDYERYLSRAEHSRKKDNKSIKDEQNAQTHEANLAQAKIDYQTADDQIRQTFPPVTAAILSLLPQLLEYQVRLQTTLVGQLYTVLDAYTRKFGFPNPPPANAEITRAWDGTFTPLRKELEDGIPLIARGKTVHHTMNLPQEKDSTTMTGLGIRNKVMHKPETKPTGLPSNRAADGDSTPTSALAIEAPAEEAAPPKPPRPSATPSPIPSPSINISSKPRMVSTSSNGPANLNPPPPYDYKPTAAYPTDIPTSATSSRYATPSPGLTQPSTDYFGARRTSAASIASSAASAAAGKKKPPPPVPAKRLPSGAQPQFVTALFDFEGQSAGDLAFREGDRIRVVKKTESTDDWWDGELNGVQGVFPANYVQL